MFKMGGKPDMNSGIVSGFEREKFSSGTGEGGDSTRRAIDIMYPDAKSSMDFQPQADLITAAKQSAAATAPAATPSMSYQQQFGETVADVPPELQRGFNLSEYLALVKLGAGIAGAPNQGKGFSGFVRSAAPAVGQFAEDIGALDRAKIVQRQDIQKQKGEAERKGLELDFTAQLQEQELLSNREIAAAQAVVDYAGDLLNVNDVQYILTNSLLLDQIIKGNPPDSDTAKRAIERKKELNKSKKDYKAELEVAMKKPGALSTDVRYLNLLALPAAEKPAPFTGLEGSAFEEAFIQDKLKGLDVDDVLIPTYDPNYEIPESTAKWFEAGGVPEQIDVERLFGFAEGGRVGFALGGTRAGGDITGMAPGMTGTTESTTAPISFEELRARLPKEVSNEVVRLLSASEGALIDFAQIQTQDDISRFNQKYNTDLQLPAQQAV